MDATSEPPQEHRAEDCMMSPSRHTIDLISQLIEEASNGIVKSPRIFVGLDFAGHADVWGVIGVGEICANLSCILREEVRPEDRPFDIAERTEVKLNILKSLVKKPHIIDELVDRLQNSPPEEWVD
jgi:hypothetical protein